MTRSQVTQTLDRAVTIAVTIWKYQPQASSIVIDTVNKDLREEGIWPYALLVCLIFVDTEILYMYIHVCMCVRTTHIYSPCF